LIESPVLELKHSAGDPDGEPVALGPTDTVYFDHWVYLDNAIEDMIFYLWDIAAQTEESACLGMWRDDNTVWYGTNRVWIPWSRNATLQWRHRRTAGPSTG